MVILIFGGHPIFPGAFPRRIPLTGDPDSAAVGAAAPAAAVAAIAPPLPPPPRAPGRSRAAKDTRIVEHFGGHAISEVTRGSMRIGWGIICGRHNDAGDAEDEICKKQITYGGGERTKKLTDDECKSALRAWVIEGYSIPDYLLQSRRDHVHKTNARTLLVQSVDDACRTIAELQK